MKKQLSVCEILVETCQAHPAKEALYDGYTRKSYRELSEEVLAIASGLKQIGIEKGDRVLVCLPNWNEFVALYFGIASLGAIIVPCNIRYQSEELRYILENSGAKAAFVTNEIGHFELFKHHLNRFPKENQSPLEHLFTVRFQADGFRSYHDLLDLGNKAPSLSKAEIDPVNDIFSILYTSGTTGKPKGAMLTHENVIYAAQITNEKLLITADDVFLLAVPCFHVFGMVPGILSAIAAGSKIVFMDTYKPAGALQLIETEKISVHHGVPTMFILELNHPDFAKFDLSSLRTGIIAAAPCPEAILQKIRQDMGCNVMVFYGLTETSASITATSFEDEDYICSVTVGCVLPGSEAKVVNGKREPVPPGVVGEIALRGPGVMKGYYLLPEQTKDALDDNGWFYTGDLVTMDERGYIRIVGRKKEMIIRGGYNIYPREVEELLYKHPSILETAIIGLPDTVLGEISCAVIKLKPDHHVKEDEIKAYLTGKVADYKIPDRVIFLDEMPMTASGKIKKVALEQALRERLKGSLR